MRSRAPLALAVALASSVAALAACSDPAPDAPTDADAATATPSATSSSTAPPTPSAATPSVPPPAASDEIPATGDTSAIEAWLATKAYTRWKCEPSPHPRRAGSGHAQNRICSNGALSAHGDGEYPVGAASVKELFDGSGNINGYATLLKVRSGGVESFYWYERIGAGVVANGMGDSGSAKSVCTGCHDGAGKNGQTGHDGVFTQVR